MKKDSIVQFVCFATKLEPEEFSPLWEDFAKKFKGPTDTINLFEVSKERKSRFRYISRLTCKSSGFRFAFMKGRNSEHFPEHAARVIQLGGYTPLQIQNKKISPKDKKILALLDKSFFDLEFCKNQSYSSLNIYEAYFENCKYGYILEYSVPEKDASLLIEQLSAQSGIEVTVYNNTLVEVG